jgi:hypothetical protein
MGCNCKANEEIEKLHNKYGYIQDVSWKTKLSFGFEETLKTIILCLVIMVLFPLILIASCMLFFTKKRVININGIIRRLLGKKQNVGIQQNI